MNIASIFETAARQWPGRTAIIDKDGRSYSFAELRNLVLRQAVTYQKKGIKSGDRVMVFVPMSVELYIAVLALFYIGASAVFLDEWVNRERMELCCKMARCKGLVASLKVKILALQSAELRKIEYWFPLPGKGKKTTSMEMALYLGAADETALITFTTGSTGTPKAANRTHGFLKAQFDALMPLTEPFPETPAGPDMPMLAVVLLLNLGRGITSVIPDFKASKPQEFQPSKVWKQILEHRVVSLTTSPYYAEQLVLKVKGNSSALRRIIIGGAAVFPDLTEKIRIQLPGVNTLIVYGSTEAEPVSHIDGDELLSYYSQHLMEHGLLVGVPDTSARVSLIPTDYQPGQAFEPLTISGQIGEICVSGPHVLKGYIDNREAELQNKIWVGDVCWHRTGDAGTLDEQGRLFLFGRVKQIIRHKGHVYYPFLVEYFARNLPGIGYGTLLMKGEELLMVVQPDEGFNREATEKTVTKHYPGTNIIYKNNIPLDPRHHSKIDYEKLSELL